MVIIDILFELLHWLLYLIGFGDDDDDDPTDGTLIPCPAT